MNEEEKQAVQDSKNIINELNNHKDKDFIGRMYYKSKPIEEILEILLNLIEKLQKELKRYQNMYRAEHAIHMTRNEQLARKGKAVLKAQQLENENTELKSKIENKDKYFDLIIGLGYDYDGYYNRETSNGSMKDLADLIDELVQVARDGLNDIPYQK